MKKVAKLVEKVYYEDIGLLTDNHVDLIDKIKSDPTNTFEYVVNYTIPNFATRVDSVIISSYYLGDVVDKREFLLGIKDWLDEFERMYVEG